MKYALIALSLFLCGSTLLKAQETQTDRQEVILLSDPVEETDSYRVFGSPFQEKDAGEDAGAISGPQKEYSLVATSVKILDRPE